MAVRKEYDNFKEAGEKAAGCESSLFDSRG